MPKFWSCAWPRNPKIWSKNNRNSLKTLFFVKKRFWGIFGRTLRRIIELRARRRAFALLLAVVFWGPLGPP